MTKEAPAPAHGTAPVVPPYAGSVPLTPAQMHCARVCIAIQELTELVQDLEACDVSVCQAVCQALAAVVELQATLRAKV